MKNLPNSWKFKATELIEEKLASFAIHWKLIFVSIIVFLILSIILIAIKVKFKLIRSMM